MASYQLTPAQEALYEAGGWPEVNLLLTINEALDWHNIEEPVAVIAADGMAVLFWLGTEQR